jgi:hypothetical protein
MARIRTVKPEFFKNDELAELPFEYRILFQGLWCLSDRRGRLEDRPKRIKAEVFPYDDVDCDKGLQTLHDTGFIERYEHEGTRYIQVTNFEKHQNCNIKEAESTIPAPCLHSADTKKKTTVGREGKGKEGKEKKPDFAGLACPDDLVFSAKRWQEYRREAKLKPYAEKTWQALFDKYRLNPTLFSAAVENSILKGYQGIFEPDQQPRGKPGSAAAPSLMERTGGKGV